MLTGVDDPVITSAANPRLRSLIALRRRRVREAVGSTLVEGYEELSMALDAGVVPSAAYVCPQLFSPAGRAGSQDIGVQEDLVAELHRLGVHVIRLSRPAFEKVAYREGPDGLIAVVDNVVRRLDDLTVGAGGGPSSPAPAPPALIVLCQGIEKPGNLGAMLRTADAAGADAVIAADPVTDWGNPNVVRASKGTVFAVPVASARTLETLTWLRDNHIALVVSTPDTDVVYTDVDYTGPVAIAVGAEKHGADDVLLTAAAERVRIPMAGRANSLNVAASTAILLYEAVRQRQPREPLPFRP